MKLVLQGEVWAGETNLVAVSTGMVFRAVSLGDVTTECGAREEVNSWQPWGTQHCGEVRKSGRGGRATQVPAGKAEGKPHLKSVFSKAEQSIPGPAVSVWLVGQVSTKRIASSEINVLGALLTWRRSGRGGVDGFFRTGAARGGQRWCPQ